MKIQNFLATVVLRILRPLARVLLSHGMSYGTFAELARRAYVDEGFAHIEKSGKRPSVSGVSALTGMTRKEVSRLRDAPADGDGEPTHRYSRAIRVISGWLNDSDYLDQAGEPALLPFEGGRGSFTGLVKQYSGDIPPAAMLSTLQASNNVVIEDGAVVLKERAYIPMATPVDKLNILGSDVAELIHTIGHNLSSAPEQRFFQRKVSNGSLRRDALPAFRELSNRKSQELLEDYNAWLSAHQANEDTVDSDTTLYVAVGIYYIELANPE